VLLFESLLAVLNMSAGHAKVSRHSALFVWATVAFATTFAPVVHFQKIKG
jgi:hypothetical protein